MVKIGAVLVAKMDYTAQGMHRLTCTGGNKYTIVDIDSDGYYVTTTDSGQPWLLSQEYLEMLFFIETPPSSRLFDAMAGV